MEGFLLIPQVHGGAEVFARVIEAGREQRGAAAIVFDRRFAFTVNQVNARAKLVAVAKATTGIQGGANLRFRGVIDADLRLRGRARVFRLKVDHPAYAGAGRAVHQGVGAFKDLNAIHHLGVNHLARQYAGEAAKGHVVAIKLQAANTEALCAVAVALHGLHARIIRHHVGDGARLLIFHQFGGVADDIKRHIHRILLTEHPHASAVCHLPVKEGRHQLVAAGFERSGGSGLHHDGVFFFALRRHSGRGNGTDGERQQRFVHYSGVVHD
ncbi:hypothetical protein D3C75_381240 [compost metagenome]